MTKYCSANASVVIFTVKKIAQWVIDHPKDVRLHHIEQLPRSVSELGSRPSDMWKDADTEFRELGIWRRLGKIWGKDVRRRYPKWMVKKYLGD